MREMTMEEVKKSEVEMLAYIDAICRENNIEYTLAGGTLIGAIRHNGFIPWDDDIDIYVLRPAYNKLSFLLEHAQNTKFKALSYENNSTYYYPFLKLCDTRTILIENGVEKIKDYGVYIDVFPVDVIPNNNSYWEKISFLKKLLGYRISTRTPKNIFKKTIRMVYKPIMKLVDINTFTKLMDKEAKKYASQDFSRVGNSVWGDGKGEEVDSSVFENYTDVFFDNKKVRIISDYDSYLKSVFGNYMQLPPIEEQVRWHDFKAWWK